MCRRISPDVDVQGKMLEILRREGSVPVYRLAKALGLTYGAAQWHIGKLEHRGLVYTVKIGSRRYVALKGVDVFAKVTVGDVIEELVLTLSNYGVKLETPLREALEMLKSKAPHVAEALRLIAELRTT